MLAFLMHRVLPDTVAVWNDLDLAPWDGTLFSLY
jgi:hypothetical protein